MTEGSPQNESSVEEIIARTEALYEDLQFSLARRWKEDQAGRQVIGYLPVCIPTELITAADMLPLGILGAGDLLEIIRGDAYFQSYICHLPRSVIELGVTGRLDLCDGFLFPSTCDVIRNLSGMWQMLFPESYVRYVDVPQDFSPELGGKWYRSELGAIRADLAGLSGREVSDDAIWKAIALHDRNRELLRQLYDLRSEAPWLAPTSEVYLVQRAGYLMPVSEHNQLLEEYMVAARASDRPLQDLCRVVVAGSFCEQPPIGMLRTLERAGCAIVDDDLLLGARYVREPVAGAGAGGDPLEALSDAFLEHGTPTAFIYLEQGRKGDFLIERVRSREADGVIFCAPSFCDPALLEEPMLISALDREGISYISFKYSENTGQFQTFREQAGTFADSLRLWNEA